MTAPGTKVWDHGYMLTVKVIGRAQQMPHCPGENIAKEKTITFSVEETDII